MTRVRGQWSLGAAGPLLAREEREEADWRTRGPCNDHDPDLWFSAADADMTRAKAICAACPVRERCESFALRNGERHGIWAGLDEDDLRAGQLIRAVPARAPRTPPRQLTVMMPDLTADEADRFWSKVAGGGCGLRWAAECRPGSGFGIFRVTRSGVQRSYRAHRFAWKLRTGTDPGALTIIQSCGDPACLTEACLRAEDRPSMVSRTRTRRPADVPAGETRRGEAQRRNAA